jgi:hypothetical protein
MASSRRLAHSVPVPLPRPDLSGNYPYITTRSYVGPPDAAYAYWNEKTGRGLAYWIEVLDRGKRFGWLMGGQDRKDI